MDGDWLGKFFSWQLAAWSALLLNIGAWLKIRNERKRDQSVEKENEWDRMLEELDRARGDRDYWHTKYLETEEKLEECQRVSLERLGRAVIAESHEIKKDRERGRPTILPGTTEDGPAGGGK